jgi:hypothetical protein
MLLSIRGLRITNFLLTTTNFNSVLKYYCNKVHMVSMKQTSLKMPLPRSTYFCVYWDCGITPLSSDEHSLKHENDGPFE